MPSTAELQLAAPGTTFLSARALILTGLAAVAGAATSDGRAEERVAADQQGASQRQAVRAIDAFAVDLYRQIGAERPSENFVISPYSVHVALAMALEGARGETAAEMGRALKLPAEALRTGAAGAEQIPWETSLLHTGHEALRKSLQKTETVEQRAVAQKVDAMRAELARVNAFVNVQSFLGIDTGAAERQAQSLAEAINAELRKVNSVELQVAQSLWAEKTYPIRDEFTQTLNRHYHTGTLFSADFKNDYPVERARINRWVSDHTGGRISQLLPSLSPEEAERLALVIANAVYFKGDWAEPFEASATRERDFHLTPASKIKAPMMRRACRLARYGAVDRQGEWFETAKMRDASKSDESQRLYPQEGGFQLLALPYRGTNISFVVVVPREIDGLRDVEALLAAEPLDDWCRKLETRDTYVYLPKFSLSASLELGATLQSLGMRLAFQQSSNGGGADFSGISSRAEAQERLFLTRVAHQATLEVDERGTVATAATAAAGVKAEERSMLVPFRPLIRVDRPFLFLIRDLDSGAILFMGRMLNPVAGRS